MRAAAEQRSIAEAVAELRDLASNRNDLLAETAGLTAGSWLASPETHVGHELIAAGLLILAAHLIDYDEVSRWVQVGLERGRAACRPVHGDPQ